MYKCVCVLLPYIVCACASACCVGMCMYACMICDVFLWYVHIQKTQAMYGLMNTKCTYSHYSKLSPLLYKIYKICELHKFFIESCIDAEIVLYSVLLFLYQISKSNQCTYVRMPGSVSHTGLHIHQNLSECAVSIDTQSYQIQLP